MTDMNPMALRIAAVQIDAVPNRLTHQQRSWLPEEPLFGPDPLADIMAHAELSVAHLASTYPQFQTTRRRLESLYIEAARLRLLRVLEFCKEHKVHLVVFPEYSIPPALLPVLVGYSTEMVVVAGIGLMRPTDVDRDDNPIREKVAPYSNCAAVIAPGVIELVTKQYPSEGEFLEAGKGPRIFEVILRERTIRLGVAICMDYIHIGHAFGTEGSHLDVVAIPALSRTTEVFAPDQPRDFVRAISNHSCYGGTRILLPRPSGAAFVTDAGTEPLFRHEEGIIVADFDKYQTAPRSTFSTRNRIVLRTSLLASPSDSERLMIETIQQLPLELAPNSEASLMVDSWIERIGDGDRLRGLQHALTNYKRLSTSGMLREDDRLLLTSHLLVPNAKSAMELRAAQANEVSATLRNLVSEDSPATIFGAQREYASLLASLRPVRKQQGVGSESESRRQTYFAIGLGRFDSDEAQRTTAYQLDLLRAFSLSFHKDFTLSYRLTTKEVAETQDKGAFFEIVLGGLAAKDAVLEQTEQFCRAYRAILLSGWACYTSDAEIVATGSHVYAVEPTEGDQPNAPAIRADWGGLVDVLRAQPKNMVLDLTCSPLMEASRVAAAAPVFIHEPGIQSASSSVHVSVTEAFAEFLSGRAVEHASDPPSLDLRIVISSEHPVSRSLLITIGSMLLGHDRFRVKSLIADNEPLPHTLENVGFTVRPDEALRIVHPPHGHIEGRGIGGRRDLKLQAKAVRVLSARLRNARLQGMKNALILFWCSESDARRCARCRGGARSRPC